MFPSLSHVAGCPASPGRHEHLDCLRKLCFGTCDHPCKGISLQDQQQHKSCLQSDHKSTSSSSTCHRQSPDTVFKSQVIHDSSRGSCQTNNGSRRYRGTDSGSTYGASTEKTSNNSHTSHCKQQQHQMQHSSNWQQQAAAVVGARNSMSKQQSLPGWICLVCKADASYKPS